MTEQLEGSDSGHPDNAVLIKREIEFEQSLEVKEAKTRDLTYAMAKDTGYKYHFTLAGCLIFCMLAVTVATYIMVARNELDAQGAMIVGTLIGVWQGLAFAAIGWVYGSSMSSQNKSKMLEAELKEDDGK